MILIDLQNLSKTYFGATNTEVLKNINLQIQQGDFVAIMGPSGSGKSTLLHILGFLSEQTEGNYFFKQKSNLNYTEEEKSQIRNTQLGFVFQSFNLLAKETIYNNVRLPLLYSNIDENLWDQKIKQTVSLVGLSHRINYETSKLSGGEKQRVAIARALICDPLIIFADEPTGNLDSKSGAIVLETLQKLHREHNHTIVLITHESKTAEHAQRLIKIEDGEIKFNQKIKMKKATNSLEK